MTFDTKLIRNAGAGLCIAGIAQYIVEEVVIGTANRSSFFHQTAEERWLALKVEDSPSQIFVKSTLLYVIGLTALQIAAGKMQYQDPSSLVHTMKNIALRSLFLATVTSLTPYLSTIFPSV